MRTKSEGTQERTKEAQDRVINRSGDMAMENKEEREELERELRKVETSMNLNHNVSSQARETEDGGGKDNTAVKVDRTVRRLARFL